MITISLNEVGWKFVQAIASRDFPAIAACFADDVQFRALVPRGLREARGPADATRFFQDETKRWGDVISAAGITPVD